MTPMEQAEMFRALHDEAKRREFGIADTHALLDDYEQALIDLRVLWHAYTTDNRPPADLQSRLAERFGV